MDGKQYALEIERERKELEIAERLLDGKDWFEQFAKAPLSAMSEAFKVIGPDANERRMAKIASLGPDLAVPAFELGANRLNWPQLIDFEHKTKAQFALIDYLCNDACLEKSKSQGSLGMWARRARSQNALALIGVSVGLALRVLGAEWFRKEKKQEKSSDRLPYASSRLVENRSIGELEDMIASLEPVLSAWMSSWLDIQTPRAERFNAAVEGSDGQRVLIGFMRQIGQHAKWAGWVDAKVGADPVYEAICNAGLQAPMAALQAMASTPRSTFEYGGLNIKYHGMEMSPMGMLAQMVAGKKVESAVERSVEANACARRELASARGVPVGAGMAFGAKFV